LWGCVRIVRIVNCEYYRLTGGAKPPVMPADA